MECDHQWQSWRAQSFWRVDGEDEPVVRTWVRQCDGCESHEYLRLPSAERPNDTTDIRGWLILPG
jgi:hypothetical protein